MNFNFDYTADEHRHITTIMNLAGLTGTDRMDAEMDLIACHSNGCPLDFERMATGHMGEIFHDLVGISENLDRKTGLLTNNFTPRFAKRGDAS